MDRGWLFGVASGTVLCRNELRESPTPQYDKRSDDILGFVTPHFGDRDWVRCAESWGWQVCSAFDLNLVFSALTTAWASGKGVAAAESPISVNHGATASAKGHVVCKATAGRESDPPAVEKAAGELKLGRRCVASACLPQHSCMVVSLRAFYA